MMIARKLELALHVCDAQVDKVKVRLPLFDANSLLRGRTPAQAAYLLPSVLSICGQAQGVASILALNAAQNRRLSVTSQRCYAYLVMLESTQECIRSLLFSLPKDECYLEVMKAFSVLWKQSVQTLHDLQSRLINAEKTESISGAQARIIEHDVAELASKWDLFCCEYVLGVSSSEWQDMSWQHGHMTPVKQWCGQLTKENDALGQMQPEALPLEALKQAKTTPEDCVGRPYDAGVLRRVNNAGQMQYALEQWGTSLAVRVWARLVDLALTLQKLLSLHNCTENCQEISDAVYSTNLGGEQGLAVVECARGILIHRVALSQGHIVKYDTYAPTDWNFHPDGVLSTLLKLPVHSHAQLREEANMLIQVLDPCVEFDVQVVEGETDA